MAYQGRNYRRQFPANIADYHDHSYGHRPEYNARLRRSPSEYSVRDSAALRPRPADLVQNVRLEEPTFIEHRRRHQWRPRSPPRAERVIPVSRYTETMAMPRRMPTAEVYEETTTIPSATKQAEVIQLDPETVQQSAEAHHSDNEDSYDQLENPRRDHTRDVWLGFDADTDFYDRFKFPTPTKSAAEPLGDDETSETDGIELEDRPLAKDDPAHAQGPRATAVYRSQYTGSAELDGDHSATLTVLHDPKGQKRSLFRWLHIRQEVMNFEDFWVEVSRQCNFTEAERSTMAKLRADLTKNKIKSRFNPLGSRVGYMEPHFTALSVEPPTGPSSGADNGPVKFVCMPYFTLQKYSGLSSASSTSSFPTQTLLQSQFSRSPQQRDMEQAVCKMGTAKRGECFHVAQIWCLVIKNSFLITCGTMPQSELEEDSLKIVTEPLRSEKEGQRSGRVLVTYGSSLVWSLETYDMMTWFDFVSHFHTFWPSMVQFRHKNLVINAEKWPMVLKQSLRPRARVTLQIEVDPEQPTTLRPVLKTDPGGTLQPEDGKQKAKQPEPFHAFNLRHGAGEAKSMSSAAAWGDLKQQLAVADKFLTEQTSFTDQKAFKSCQGSTRMAAQSYLANLAEKVAMSESDPLRQEYEEKITAFNCADDIFLLFFPVGFDGPTTGIFWGALQKMIEMPQLSSGSRRNPYSTATIPDLNGWVQEIRAFQNIVAWADDKTKAKMGLPQQFVTAWLNLLSGLVHCSQPGPWREHLDRARGLTSSGMRVILAGISKTNLMDEAAVLPMDVSALLIEKLLKDHVGKSDDIAETYSQYLTSIDVDITTKAPDRSYQHRLDLVRQEINAVMMTLGTQRSLLSDIRKRLTAAEENEIVLTLPPTATQPQTSLFDDNRRYRSRENTPGRAFGHEYDTPGSYDDIATASKLSPTSAGGFRSLFFLECARFIEERDFDFRRFTEYTDDLERAVAFKMEWTKDRQENAIYAFTLVTIVFLPISAVSSIFGMNTSDIRDMEFNQWLYWAVAIPVTLGTILAGLWWMNELENLSGWVTGKRKMHRSSGGGYVSSAASPPTHAIEESYYGDAEEPAEMVEVIPEMTERERVEPRGRVQRMSRAAAPVMVAATRPGRRADKYDLDGPSSRHRRTAVRY